MRLYSFFSGSHFIGEKFKHFYLYGNDSPALTFRYEFLRWWFTKQGYQLQENETLEEYQPEPSLFAPTTIKPVFLLLKKAPKSLDALRVPCAWQASSTKNALHERALKAPSIAALACYELKPEEMIPALRYYLRLEFQHEADPKVLQKAAQNLCHEPHFFFSEAFKMAIGALPVVEENMCEEEDLMGAWRLKSAMVLRKLKTEPSKALWHELRLLRQQELLFKSGSAATHDLIKYYQTLKSIPD